LISGGSRIADDAIYLGEDRFARPKETFKMVANAIQAGGHGASASLLDIGCATGEFLYYVGERFPGFQRAGIDISEAMIQEARRRVPDADFTVGSAGDQRAFKTQAHDIVTLQGVLSIFDDPMPVICNALGALRNGGAFYGLIIANEEPVDVIMRYRRVAPREPQAEGAVWESGWNVFSMQTIESILVRQPRCAGWTWTPFRMPFALEKRDDPMRCWTIATEHNPNQRVNGACQLVNSFLLSVRMAADAPGSANPLHT